MYIWFPFHQTGNFQSQASCLCPFLNLKKCLVSTCLSDWPLSLTAINQITGLDWKLLIKPGPLAEGWRSTGKEALTDLPAPRQPAWTARWGLSLWSCESLHCTQWDLEAGRHRWAFPGGAHCSPHPHHWRRHGTGPGKQGWSWRGRCP